MIRFRRSEIAILDACRLLGVSRSQYYRKASPARAPDLALEAIALEHPRFGYRRLAVLLGRPTKVVRVQMSKLGLMAKRIRKRKLVHKSIPIEAENLSFKALETGQLLASDFTYIALSSGQTGYFAVTLDVYSRRILGWNFCRNMSKTLVISALERAIANVNLSEHWLHHSDRGSQYTSVEFQSCVLASSGHLSYSYPASPQENAYLESFFSRFKDEVVSVRETLNFEDTLMEITEFVSYYNENRPHSSLGNLSPLAFERIKTEQILQESVA